MYEYLEESVQSTNIVGSFIADKDVDFRDNTKHLFNTLKESYQINPIGEIGNVLQTEQTREAYKELFLEDVRESAQMVGDAWVSGTSDKLEQLFENTCWELIAESAYGQLQPIVGLSLPVLKKVWLKCPLNDILMTEVPDKPVIKTAIERQFLKDSEGNKYYIPEIFYNDDFAKVSAKGRGKAINSQWYPNGHEETLPIQDLNILEESGGSLQLRDTIGYDFAIVALKVKDGEEDEMEIAVNDIQPNYAANGTFFANVDYVNSDEEEVHDTIVGRLDSYYGTVSVASTSGNVLQVKFGGHLQNVNNNQTLELDYEREQVEWKIPDSTERLNTGLPVEKIKDYKTLFDMDITTKVVSDMGDTLANFEDNSGLKFLEDSFEKWNDKKAFPYGYEEGFTDEWNFSCQAPGSTTFVTTSQWIDTELKYHLNRAIDELKTKLKREDLMFVIYGNPSNITLIQDSVKWIIDQDTKMGGVEVDYRFGVMAPNKNRMHVVSTMKVAKDKGLRIVAYPLSKEVITFKHYKYSLNIENAYRNPNTPLTPNVMATSRYLTTELFPVQGKFNLTDNDFGKVSKL